ncbi:hypothetical protein K501DRAFT_230268 [Backusella circina FSU 941]|nr:hypothetical protein K501DRAFT_230268 [Backusella circina FSU 941]
MNDFNVYVKYILTTKALDFDLVFRKQHCHQERILENEQQQVNKPTIPPNDEEKVPQFDIICNECCRSIKNNRWRCSTCDDFDLCSTCKARVNHDPKHTLHYIEPEARPSQNNGKSDSTEKSNSPHMDYMCDYCDAYIVGVRHRCSACPDFDLCHSCFGIVKDNHPDHPFITYLVGTQAPQEKIKQQQQKKKSQPVAFSEQTTHHGVHCDNCHCLVKGIRYKCGHCPDFDLCERCESTSSHDKTHILLKIRTPLQEDQHPSFLPSFKSPAEDVKKEEQAKPRNQDSASLNVIPQPVINSKMGSAILSEPSSSISDQPEKKLDGVFVSDLNIPDGTNIIPKKTFIKMWKLKNTGEIKWPQGCRLLFNGGDILRPYPTSHPDSCVVPSIEPEEEVCILAELQAPDAIGYYSSYFGICTPDGTRFGDIVSCSIQVAEDPIDEDTETLPDSSMIFPRSLTEQTDTLSSMPSTYEPSFESISVISSSERSTFTNTSTIGYTLSRTDSNHSNNNHHSHHSVSTAYDQFSDDDFVIVEEDEGEDDEGEEEDISSSSHTVMAKDIPLGNEEFTTVYNQYTECITEEYQLVLQKVQEMGFTDCEEVVKELLDTYQGDMKKIITRLSEEEEFR